MIYAMQEAHMEIASQIYGFHISEAHETTQQGMKIQREKEAWPQVMRTVLEEMKVN
jgi:hypothetical protein